MVTRSDQLFQGQLTSHPGIWTIKLWFVRFALQYRFPDAATSPLSWVKSSYSFWDRKRDVQHQIGRGSSFSIPPISIFHDRSTRPESSLQILELQVRNIIIFRQNFCLERRIVFPAENVLVNGTQKHAHTQTHTHTQIERESTSNHG